MSNTTSNEILKKNSDSYQEMPKPFLFRVVELSQSLQVIYDCIQLIKQNKTYQLIPLCGQLRALLSEKDRRNKPLLIDLASLLDKKLSIYVMPGVDENEIPFKEEVYFHMAGPPFSTHKTFLLQEEIDLIEFLDKKTIKLKNKDYSVNYIIEKFANKAGGAHYSPSIPSDFAEMLSIKVDEVIILNEMLYQIGLIVLEIGREFLKSIVDFDLHAIFCIPKQEIKQNAFIFDYKHPESNMRLSLELNEHKKLLFSVTGCNTPRIFIMIDQLIDIHIPFHFSVSFSIEEDFFTSIKLLINGEYIAEGKFPFPIILISREFSQYQKYLNKSFDQECSIIRMGFGELIFSQRLKNVEKSHMNIYFEQRRTREDQRFVIYTKGSYGYAPPGINNIEKFGNVINGTIDILIENDTEVTN